MTKEDKMKKIFSLVIVLVIVAVALSVMTGCGKREFSSKEEAMYATRELPEFKEITHYLSVKGLDDSLLLSDTFRIGGSKSSYRKAHIIVYKDIRDSIEVVIWDDKRPPQKIK